MANTLLTTLKDGILHIEFNRPDKKNAITLEMYGLAADALEYAHQDKAIRVVILSGRGECFTSGNDLGDFLSASAGELDNRVMRFLKALPLCTKPVIAAIHSHAVGIGTTMLLHCDLVYADKSARLQMPFVNLGLCPEFASSLLLPQLVGQQRAAELLLLAEPIDADTACRYGLINAVVNDASATAFEKARQLAAKPAAAIRLTKSLLHEADQHTLISRIEMEGIEFAKCMQSPEAKEAVAAFMERRTADFSQFH